MKVLQTVHGAVIVIVDIVVRVLTAVIVTGTAGGVLVTVTIEPLPLVVVEVTGGGVELVTIGETEVVPDDEVIDEEAVEEDDFDKVLATVELVRSMTFALTGVVEELDARSMTGAWELLAAMPVVPHGKETVLVTVVAAEPVFVTVIVAVGEQI